jgi:phage gp36-like protein
MMLLGIYKNVEELEESLSLEELEAILVASRDKEHERMKFQAALKGVNLDDVDDDEGDRFELTKAKAEAILAGKSAEEAEYDFFGIDIDTD